MAGGGVGLGGSDFSVMASRKKLACVTMAHNEADMLPLWLRHYDRQVGLEACYVLDHGSNDGSTAELKGAHHLRLEYSPLDEVSPRHSSVIFAINY